MVHTVLLALALALGGGAPHLGSLLDMVSALWTTDQVDAGNHTDPDGATTTGDAGNSYDPNGTTGDAGNHLDPDG
ncbi:MAG TPA: hypothetical protein VEW48_22930 [Thermoanaerobaculia bacterium]|nr:hypothetical protein [Thermoanaerobaculia bacterium]